MKPITALIILMLIAYCSPCAQRVDSLLQLWEDESANDTLRFKALHQVTRHYLYSNPDSCFYYSGLERDFARKLGPGYEAMALNMVGGSHWMKRDFVAAMAAFQEGYELRKATGSLGGMSESLNNIGNIYFVQGDYPKALEYYLKSLKLDEKAGNTSGIADSYFNIGVIYAEIENDQQAVQYLEKSLALYEEEEDVEGMAQVYNNLGAIYRSMGQDDKALERLEEAYRLLGEQNNKVDAAVALSNMGNVFVTKKEFDKALEHYLLSLEIYRETGNREGIATIYGAMCETYRLMGLYQRAEQLCLDALEIARDLQILPEQRETAGFLYSLYKDRGDSERALRYYELRSGLEDSIKERETADLLARMEFQQQVIADSLSRAKRELEQEMAHRQEVLRQKNRKKTYMYSGIGLFILALALVGRVRYMRRANDQISAEKARSDKLLLNILPAEVAEELKSKGEASANEFSEVTVLFSDFVDFTEVSEKLNPKQLVEELNVCFKAFDEIADRYGVEKIKTIGDAYMAAGGLPVSSPESVARTIRAALEMQAFMRSRMETLQAVGKRTFSMRIGLHTGTVVAGIVGLKKFQYDIWGDTVNTASRMETAGQAGRVNISQATWELVKNDPDFSFERRGSIQVKGKGEMEMFFVELTVDS